MPRENTVTQLSRTLDCGLYDCFGFSSNFTLKRPNRETNINDSKDPEDSFWGGSSPEYIIGNYERNFLSYFEIISIVSPSSCNENHFTLLCLKYLGVY